MKYIKLFIISFVVISLLITGISLFFPSRVRISKAIDINASKEKLMVYLADPVKWRSWFPGGDTLDHLYIDGEIKGIRLSNSSPQGIMITGKTDSTVTASNVGPGIRELVMGWNVFPGPAGQNTATVQWYMDFHLRWYPWEKFSSLLFEKRYGPSMEQGLTKLKSVVEK